ncbi:MAG: lipopolysaccharide kinase InaA family protein, partial [Lentisphaeria bacterium]|nr:lipopolysaccharide kinase InaA family protein [Lentisphaeria bacterium]
LIKKMAYDPSDWELVRSRDNVLVAKHKTDASYLKIFHANKLRHQLAYFLGHSRAKKAAAGSAMLMNAGIKAPAITEIKDGCCIASIVMDAVEGIGVYDYVMWLTQEKKENAESQKKALFSALGELIAKMHQRGIFHGDLRPNNLLLASENGKVTCTLIDNDRTRKAFRKGRESIRNLMQLMMIRNDYISDEIRGYFFEAYGNGLELTPDTIKMFQEGSLAIVQQRLNKLGAQTIVDIEKSDLYDKIYDSTLRSFL